MTSDAPQVPTRDNGIFRPEMIFVIGAPRSGTTMLERMLSSHSQILGGPEPHLITPLAHLGVWDKVDKAPYDAILAAEAQKLFVSRLPRGEADYWDACRAYCDILYGRYLQAHGPGKRYCLDKTPAYALVLPFLARIYPDARYVVLTRHPIAVFASFAESFFDDDWQEAHRHNPIIERYVPAIADFLRQDTPSRIHVRYEDLVRQPEPEFQRICAYLDLPFEQEAIEYGRAEKDTLHQQGLGDPTGVNRHQRPTTASVSKWVAALLDHPDRIELMRRALAKVSDEDLNTVGYPRETLWAPLEKAGAMKVKPPRASLTRYRIERKIIVRGRALVRRVPALRRFLQRCRLFLDVLLREQ